MRRKRRQNHDEPTINLTPLIDVVFVILIMFILIAPLLEIDHIELAEGKKEGSEKKELKEAGPIAIRVLRDNSLRFNQQETTLPQLPKQLKQAKSRHPGASPQILHDKRASFGTYQSVKNAVEAAGFEEMDIVLAPE